MPQTVQQSRRLGKRQLSQVNVQKFIQKCQCLMCLFQRPQWVLFGLGHMFEKSPDFTATQLAGMSLSVKQNIAPRPFDVSPTWLGPPESRQGGQAQLIQ
jgi:hypothetical protein